MLRYTRLYYNFYYFLDQHHCVAIINHNEEDQMQITGYRHSRKRAILCWICICLTAGLLRLVLHWWRHWFLIATHEMCPLDVAEMVLIEEVYQGKHKVYYVKQVPNLCINSIKQNKKYMDLLNLPPDCQMQDLYFSVHYSSSHFKSKYSIL